MEDWLLTHAEKVGIIGHLAFDVVALIRGWVVPGRNYDALMEEKNQLRAIVDASNTRDRDKLDRVEQRLEDALRPRS